MRNKQSTSLMSPETGSGLSESSPASRPSESRHRRRVPRLAGLGLALVLVSLASFGAGVAATVAFSPAPAAQAQSADDTWRKLDIFAKVLSYIRNNYVEELDESALIYGAIRGMLGTLDSHTVFMDPREYRSLKDDTVGEFGGLGMELAIRGRDLVVLAPIDDTPAARAGIRPGDLITAIDGKRTRGLPLSKAVELLKGPPGSSVSIELFRDGFTAARRFTLVRDRIRVLPVESRLIDGKVGYVRIKSFQDRTDRHLQRALEELRERAGPEFEGLILDLRSNPGGLLDQGVKVANRFLNSGTIVTTRGRSGRHSEEEATPHGTEPDYPVVVLINNGTASASEIVAGALQDHQRAVLVGDQTFGKGSVQTVIEFDDGSGLKLTIAHYYTPSGRSIHEKGIVPDVRVSPTPRKPREAREQLPSDVSPYELPVVDASTMDGPLPRTASDGTSPADSELDGTSPAVRVAAAVEESLEKHDNQLDVALSILREQRARTPHRDQ